MSSSNIIYRALTASDVDCLTNVYAEAFDDNTACNHVFQYDKETQPDYHFGSLKWLFERRIGIVLEYKSPTYVAVDADTGAILGAACCVFKDTKPGVFGLLKHGLLSWPFYWGVYSAMRGISLDEEFDALEKLLYPDSQCQVQMVAVSPSHQGKGVGKGLVRTLLSDERLSGLAISLFTQKERNLSFYEGFGFKDAKEHTVCGFKTWTMFRPAP